MKKQKTEIASLKKIAVIFGTRPEAIKICPLIRELKKNKAINLCVCVSGQHEKMLEPILSLFEIEPSLRLSVMREGQSLALLNERIFCEVGAFLDAERPSLVAVHGDTATAFASALACFFRKIPIAHVEAGLRTYDSGSPYPEEFNRRAISVMAELHFAPTEEARENLLREGIDKSKIFVTGNTAVDALSYTVRKNYSSPLLDAAKGKKLILLTVHRRENLGEPMRRIFRAVRRMAVERPEVYFLYPLHANPAVQKIAKEELLGCEGIKLCEPLDVFDFHNILARSFFVMTDSGGIQEEAPSFGVPVLLLRNNTERAEGLRAGGVMLAGSEEETVYKAMRSLLEDSELYKKMSLSKNPFGDGRASFRIAEIISKSII